MTVVAVLDTGVRFEHPDLLRLAQAGKLLDGFDFISQAPFANDGNGRDADASDPGDFRDGGRDAAGAIHDCEGARTARGTARACRA